jgi:GDP-4-dehydro-6-deoxy-D-mannose reductase
VPSERRALVTGAAGFVGRWLVRALAGQGWAVAGTGLTRPDAGGDDALQTAAWYPGDVRDAAHLAATLDAARPDLIVHLAAVSHVPAASADPGLAAEVNVVAAARLLGLVRERRHAGVLDPVVLVVGSGEQYGRHDGAQPLDERAEQRPHSVYAATKSAQEALALEAWRSAGVRVIAARPFTHSGPGQDPRFVLPGLVRRALALRAGGGDAVRLGNQAPVRDFLHVADVAAAYTALADRGQPGEVYNVATGQGRSVGEVARRVLERVGIDARLESDPALVRPADVPVLIGNPAKIGAHTGWAPRRSFDTLIDDLVAEADTAGAARTPTSV